MASVIGNPSVAFSVKLRALANGGRDENGKALER
jgi:hypothetical protein